MAEADEVLRRIVEQLPQEERTPLVLGPGETLVPLALVDDPAWLSRQIQLRGRRWETDDLRVLTTLWWYSASSWTIGPTVTSLAMDQPVLSAETADLSIHWLPDSRITGASSSHLCAHTGDRIEMAAQTIRRLYEHVLPLLAAYAGIRERPLWAIAADALADRLLRLGRALASTRQEVERVTSLLGPLTAAIGAPLPRPRYTRTDDPTAMHTHRCSCCLLYRAPGQDMCDSCPRGGRLRRHSVRR